MAKRRPGISYIPKHWKKYPRVVESCIDHFVDQPNVAPANRASLRDALCRVLLSRETSQTKEVADAAETLPVLESIRSCKQWLIKALRLKNKDIPAATKEMVKNGEVDFRSLWAKVGESLYTPFEPPKKKAKIKLRDDESTTSSLSLNLSSESDSSEDESDEQPASKREKELQARISALNVESELLKEQVANLSKDKEKLAKDLEKAKLKKNFYKREWEKCRNVEHAAGQPGPSKSRADGPNNVDVRARIAQCEAAIRLLQSKHREFIGEVNGVVGRSSKTWWMEHLTDEQLEQLSNHWTLGDPASTFRIGKDLGNGRYGAVKSAELRSNCALKKIPIKRDAELLTRLIREGEQTYRLQHENLLPTLDCYIDEENVYLVQPLMEGGDLFAILNKQATKRFSEPAAAHLVHEILKGLDFIHSEGGVVHRDVKLDNILVSLTGEVRIADFGLCGELRQTLRTDAGTARHKAPEVARAKGTPQNAAVDIWAVAIVLFLMVTGTYPFYSIDDSKVTKDIIYGKVLANMHDVVKRSNIRLSDDCIAFLERCICMNPQERSSAKELMKTAFVRGGRKEEWMTAFEAVMNGRDVANT